MLQSHFYPFHTQDQALKYPFCSCLPVHIHPHLVHPKKLLTMTHELHRASCPTRSFMQFNIQGDTKLRQVKFQFGYFHLPPLNPDPMPAKARRGLGGVLGPGESCSGWSSRWEKRKVSLFHNLNDILVLQRMVFTHFLRIVLHRETPDQSVLKFFNKIFVNLHAEILHCGPGVRQHHWGCIIWQLAFGFGVNPH